MLIAAAAFPAPRGADDSRKLFACERCRMVGTTNELLRADGVYSDSPVDREPAVGACIPLSDAAVPPDA